MQCLCFNTSGIRSNGAVEPDVSSEEGGADDEERAGALRHQHRVPRLHRVHGQVTTLPASSRDVCCDGCETTSVFRIPHENHSNIPDNPDSGTETTRPVNYDAAFSPISQRWIVI